jgi:hypothetical protein
VISLHIYTSKANDCSVDYQVRKIKNTQSERNLYSVVEIVLTTESMCIQRQCHVKDRQIHMNQEERVQVSNIPLKKFQGQQSGSVGRVPA